MIQGADEGSGVAAIYVNGNEFTELTNGALQVRLQKADTTYQYFTLQVRDNAGNISENYKVANPYYEDPEAVKKHRPERGGAEKQFSSRRCKCNTAYQCKKRMLQNIRQQGIHPQSLQSRKMWILI